MGTLSSEIGVSALLLLLLSELPKTDSTLHPVSRSAVAPTTATSFAMRLFCGTRTLYVLDARVRATRVCCALARVLRAGCSCLILRERFRPASPADCGQRGFQHRAALGADLRQPARCVPALAQNFHVTFIGHAAPPRLSLRLLSRASAENCGTR